MDAGVGEGEFRLSGGPGLCPACFQPCEGADPCACGYDPSSPVPARPLRIGTVLNNGRFRIGRVLGEGSFAIVYLAREAGGNRSKLVAIKEYLPLDLAGRAVDGLKVAPRTARTGSPGFDEGLKAFEAEGALLSSIHHPNVVEVSQRFNENDTAYIVMPWRPGWTLAERITKLGSLLPAEAAQVGLKVLAALRGLHEGPQPCVHRDVKPENIYLCDDGTVLLLDFGAATKPGQGPAQPGFDHATPGYAPPEQWKTTPLESSVPAVDIHAWAAVIHKALTGAKPPVADNREVPLTIPPSKDALSRLLWDCVRRGLSFTPAKRPTAAVLQSRLRGLLERPSRGQWIGAAALMVVCVALLAVLYSASQVAEKKRIAEQAAKEQADAEVKAQAEREQAKIARAEQQLRDQEDAEKKSIAQQKQTSQAQANAPTTVTRSATVCGDYEMPYTVYTRPLQQNEKLAGVWHGNYTNERGSPRGCGVLTVHPADAENWWVEFYYSQSGLPTKIPSGNVEYSLNSQSEYRFTEEKGRGGSTWSFKLENNGLYAEFTNLEGKKMKAIFRLVPGSR